MKGAAEIIAALSGLFGGRDKPDADQRTAAYWGGANDPEVGWSLAQCALVNPPRAQAMYIAHVAEDVRHARKLKEWAYRAAVEFAGIRGSGQRRRSLVEAYRPEWGHQAARDGLAIALWPHLRDEVPGIGKRAEQFRCGKQCYQRVRDEITQQACDLIAGFRLDMQQCLDGRYSRDFRERWETVTGAEWKDA